jgi:hypothetical protein
MANSTFRVGGGYTFFSYNGKPLVYVDVVRETAPRPVAAPQAIQPLDQPYPIEIALPAALEAGTIEITFREQWSTEVWEQLGGPFVHTEDLLEVFKAQLQQGTVNLTKVIGQSETTPVRTITYHNCYVVNVMIDETVNIGTMTLPKSIQLMYTRRTEQWPS